MEVAFDTAGNLKPGFVCQKPVVRDSSSTSESLRMRAGTQPHSENNLSVRQMLQGFMATKENVDSIARQLLEMPIHIDPVFVGVLLEHIDRSWDLDVQKIRFMDISKSCSTLFAAPSSGESLVSVTDGGSA